MLTVYVKSGREGERLRALSIQLPAPALRRRMPSGNDVPEPSGFIVSCPKEVLHADYAAACTSHPNICTNRMLSFSSSYPANICCRAWR